MVEPQASQFWKAAVRSGLLDEATLKAAWEEIPADKRTGEASERRLARQVVNSGKLTLWQAQQILAGRWQGLRIDKYELLNVIGHGGMGRVYLARDTRLKRLVALKILSRERMNNPRALARFRREAKVGAQLQHENLVRIYDEGEAHGVHYLVMEYIEGRNVGQMIAELGRLPSGTAADIARQVALGLEHLHQKGLLHRDVNPMNILIDHRGLAKLTDLGLAIDTGDADDIVTRDGATVGTFDYIAPEQAKHSRAADMRSDVYSLGCTLYHMIAGRVPFPLPSLPEKLYAHQLSEPEPIPSLAPDVPPGLEAIVRKSMKKRPEERYARPVDLARALEPFARGLPQDDLFKELGSGVTTPPSAHRPADATSGVTPVGSDPDLDLNRGVAASPPPITPASDPLDFIPKINLGPEPPLSGVRSPARTPLVSKDLKERLPKLLRHHAPKLLIGSGLLAAVAVIVLAWGLRGRIASLFRPSPSARTPSAGSDGKSGKTGVPPLTSGEILVHFPRGQDEPEATLREAIERSAGREYSEVVLKGGKSLPVGEPGKTLMMTWGQMVIRASEGGQPELVIPLVAKEPWMEVGAQAKLKLVGLRIVVEASEKAGDSPVLIQANGDVEFERCTFIAAGNNRGTRAIVSEGLKARMIGCVFEGFDRPIAIASFPDSLVHLSQCLFVRDPTADLAAGWAIWAHREGGATGGSRKLELDHCTVVGTGLLAAEGFDPEHPLAVSLHESAIKSRALVMTAPSPAEMLGKVIAWAGKENWYQVSEASWAVVLPRGFAGPAGMPTDLKTWSDRLGGESGGREGPIPFVGSMQGEGRPVEDFAVKGESGKPPVGIDPKALGQKP